MNRAIRQLRVRFVPDGPAGRWATKRLPIKVTLLGAGLGPLGFTGIRALSRLPSVAGLLARSEFRSRENQLSAGFGISLGTIFGIAPLALRERNGVCARIVQGAGKIVVPRGNSRPSSGTIFLQNSPYEADGRCCTIKEAAAQPYVGACVPRKRTEGRDGEVQMIWRGQCKRPGYKVSKHRKTVVLYISSVAVQSGAVT